MYSGYSVRDTWYLKKNEQFKYFIRFFFLWIFILSGCGPKEDPTLVMERKMVTRGVEILRSGTAIERDSVIRTFYQLTNPVLLHPFLNDTDPNVLIGMVSALGYLKDKTAAAALSDLLKKTSDYLLQETVIYALGEISDTSSVPLLVGMLEDKTTRRDLRLSIPITLASFSKTEAAGKVEKSFIKILESEGSDLELCSYIAVGMLEILSPGNMDLFRKYVPLLRQMAERRKAESGEDGIWTNFQLTIQELENYKTPAVSQR